MNNTVKMAKTVFFLPGVHDSWRWKSKTTVKHHWTSLGVLHCRLHDSATHVGTYRTNCFEHLPKIAICCVVLPQT